MFWELKKEDLSTCLCQVPRVLCAICAISGRHLDDHAACHTIGNHVLGASENKVSDLSDSLGVIFGRLYIGVRSVKLGAWVSFIFKIRGSKLKVR